MPSKEYNSPETKLTFKGSGGDATMTFASTPDGLFAASSQYDRGTDSKPGFYRWRCTVKVVGSVLGQAAWLYLVQTDDSTHIPGRLSTSDQELLVSDSFNATRNLGQPIGIVNADISSTESFTVTGVCFVYFRYITFAIYNNLGGALSATESDSYFEMTPIPPEVQ